MPHRYHKDNTEVSPLFTNVTNISTSNKKSYHYQNNNNQNSGYSIPNVNGRSQHSYNILAKLFG